jgi:hypothetical protein
MPALDKTIVRGYCAGEDAGYRVINKILSAQLTGMRDWHAGSIQLPTGATEVIDFNLIAQARMMIIETNVSCTVTFADSQKVNVDGLHLQHVWTNKSVVDITVVQSTGVTGTINWIAVE